MEELPIVEYSGNRILTTSQVAKALGTVDSRISENFNRNKDHYTLGKHYFALEGREKREFLNRQQIADGSKNAKYLYLWTEKGLLMHVKSVNTDIAWKAHEELVDTYFQRKKQSQQERTRQFAWTEEAEQLRQINLKEIRPGYWSIAAFILQKLIYVDLGNMTPDERAKIDISFGQFFSRWLKGDRTGQLKNCSISPEHPYSAEHILDIGHVIDSKTKRSFPVYHYANLYSGDRDNFWELWYAPVILPVYFNGKLPDGLPRMNIPKDMEG